MDHYVGIDLHSTTHYLFAQYTPYKNRKYSIDPIDLSQKVG